MKAKPNLALVWMAAIAMLSFTFSGEQQKAKDYLDVPGPLEFNSVSFYLDWSSHPGNSYYKQEYLPQGQRSESFNNMMIIEVLAGSVDIAVAVKQKMSELDARKKTDPVTNYSIIKNASTGEYLLDFVISNQSGKQEVAEWNAYRYVQLDKQGAKKGLLLFAYCRRSYGFGIDGFLKSLKTERQADIKRVATYKIPPVKIKAG